MFPFLNFSFIRLPMYGLSIAFGIFFAGVIGYFISKKEKIAFEDFLIYASCVLLFGLIGAKLFYIFITFPISEIASQILLSLMDRKVAASGFVFYGGLLFSIIGFFIAKRITKTHILPFVSIFSILMPFVHGFGRIGCFCGGCCYGIKYEGIFSVVYKNPISSVPADCGIFPVQLFESFSLIILGITMLILWGFFRKTNKFLISFYLLSYSLIRFFLEFLRGDVERGFLLCLSTSQIISIVIFCFGLVLFFMKNKNLSKSDSEQISV